MPDLPPMPQFTAELERTLRRRVVRRARRRTAGRAATTLALTGLVAVAGIETLDRGPGDVARAAQLTLPDGQTLLVHRDASVTVRTLRRAFDERGLQVDVVQAPATGAGAGRVLAVFAPAGARPTASGFRLAERSGATTVVVGRAPRRGEEPVDPSQLGALAAGEAERLAHRLVVSPTGGSRAADVPAPHAVRQLAQQAASAALLAGESASPAVAAKLPEGTAEVRVMSHGDGTRVEQVTGSDGRFATRTYDRRGELVSELTEDGRRGLQWSRDSGRTERFEAGGATHDDRFEKWELTLRAQIRRGWTKLAGETTVDGRPAYELVSDPDAVALKGVPYRGQPGVHHAFVDRETWVPLRAERHHDGEVTVTSTTASRIVPLRDAEPLLTPRRAVPDSRR